jgi:cytochrome o ubiquinol oxidase operon protein cyoD
MKPRTETGTVARRHLTGFVLAVLLTAIPFVAVWQRLLDPHSTMWVIALAGVAQVMLHLRVFLGVRIRPDSQGKWISLVFAAVLLFIMTGGTLWIMTNLGWRMAH